MKNSKLLTKQLATLGQLPAIYKTVKKQKYNFPHELKNGIWKIVLPVPPEDELLEIKGNNVAFQECLIGNLRFLLSGPLRTMPLVPDDLPISSPAGSELMADWADCAPSFFVLVTEIKTLQTNDSFSTWTEVRVPQGILSDSERHSVTDVCLADGMIFFLINGILYLKSFSDFVRLGKNSSLPSDEILGITSRKWCWRNYLLKFSGKRSSVAVWTKNSVFLGHYYPPGTRKAEDPHALFKFRRIMTTVKLKHLLSLSSAGTLTIHTVEYTVHPLELAVFFSYYTTRTSGKDIYLIIHNEDTKQWTQQDFVLNVPSDSVLVSRFLYSAFPEFLLWDQHRIYYSYHNFTVSGVLQTPTQNGNLSRLSQNSTIHDVFLDNFGNIVIKMKNNVMFYSKSNIKDAIQLHPWANKTLKAFLGLTVSGKLYFIYILKNERLDIQPYPLRLEVQSLFFQTNEKCPFLAFHNSLLNVFYFLDKNDKLLFWAQVLYPQSTGVDIVLESYGPKIIEDKMTLNYQLISGQCSKTVVIDLFQSVNYEAANDYFKLQEQNTGIVLYNIQPSKHSKSCMEFKKVFQVAVGCNRKKYIVVKGFPKICFRHNFSYVIDKSFLRHRPEEDLKVKYNLKLYGCPLRRDFREMFKPEIQLFNENGFVEDIKVNFIVWEIHGRDDYSFNTTMRKSGCLNEAQTWKSMTELNKHLPLEQAWGPENYKPCFSYAIGKPGDLNQPYEIINQSNYNHIIWPLDHSGMYVFGVKILDPNYSFCNLTTIFAIETFGFVPRPSGYVVASFLFILMLLFFSILVLSYFKYIKIYRQYLHEPLQINRRKQKKKM
ncbi:PREDICTED: uncharacterized protein C1orf101 homolog [Elephantulus edwardii]|uniref:uncharacterized protein C1orf101 homolog n=1 Tax=Elephantulus edwardii TaxID=28737 RepID=UPI0003F0B956|nr:PREDICTED: uncharacterized protein C1orf101 homolog [Elephantulus edwardii]